MAAEAIELTFPRSGGVMGKTKYMRRGDDIYLVDLERQAAFTDWEAAINAIVNEEALISMCRFFIVWTCAAYPGRLSPGKFEVVKVVSSFRDNWVCVNGFREALCPQEVQEAFREEIGQPA